MEYLNKYFTKEEQQKELERLIPLVTPNDNLSKALKLLSEKEINKQNEKEILLNNKKIEENGIDIRDFDITEITEINNYVRNQIPQSTLPQLFILNDEPIAKTKIFLIIFRIMTGIRDFVEKKETKHKLDLFMKDAEAIYESSYNLFNQYLSSESEYIKYHVYEKILKIVDTNKKILNKFINSFIVFAERQELISTESVSGIKLDTPEGIDIYKKLSEKVEE